MAENNLIRVTLEAPCGERWDAIGGGESLDAAIQFAVASAPVGKRWSVLAWRHVYGD
jgi:hypothetical protein